jgi:hypothetical protein
MKKYQFEGYDIATPFTIVSNEPMFDIDAISLKKQRSSQGVQRWELGFNLVPTNEPSSLLLNIIDFDDVKSMPMPQLNDVNKRVGTTTGSSPTTTTYTVTASGGKFYIDGNQNPTLTFVEGNTYIFDQSDSSNSTHPLRFSTNSNGSPQYTTGVTVNGTQGQAGANTTIVVASGAPSTLYYYCTNHANMGNSVTVNAASGTTINYPKGAFITGTKTVNSVTNYKVYMIKSDASSVVDSNLYPTPLSGTTYSTVANATIRYYRDISDVRGITFSDGVLADTGSINIIEAV